MSFLCLSALAASAARCSAAFLSDAFLAARSDGVSRAGVLRKPRALRRFWDGDDIAGLRGFGMTIGTEQQEDVLAKARNSWPQQNVFTGLQGMQLKMRDGSMIANLCLLDIYYFTRLHHIFWILNMSIYLDYELFIVFKSTYYLRSETLVTLKLKLGFSFGVFLVIPL